MTSAPHAPVSVVIPEGLWEPHPEEEAFLVEWLAEDGSRVQEGDHIAQVMVDKVTLDVAAPATGRLAVAAAVETPVRPGTLIAQIHPGSDDA